MKEKKLDFMAVQKLQMIFYAPDKTELIGNECKVILAVHRTMPNVMNIRIYRYRGVIYVDDSRKCEKLY